MTENIAPLVVCDAGPIIHLDELGCLDLLSAFPRVLVSKAVWKEVEKHKPEALKSNHFEQTSVELPIPAELEAIAVAFCLHTGEREAIRVARTHSPCILLTDDTAARLTACNLGIRVHGTIGVLIRSVRQRLRTKDAVLAILKSIPTCSTLHLKRSLLHEVIKQVEAYR